MGSFISKKLSEEHPYNFDSSSLLEHLSKNLISAHAFQTYFITTAFVVCTEIVSPLSSTLISYLMESLRFSLFLLFTLTELSLSWSPLAPLRGRLTDCLRPSAVDDNKLPSNDSYGLGGGYNRRIHRLSRFIPAAATFIAPSVASASPVAVPTASSPSISSLDQSFMRRYLKKWMWKGTTFDMFEETYVSTITPPPPVTSSSTSYLLRIKTYFQIHLKLILPVLAVSLFLVVVCGSWAIDEMIRRGKERERREEIELYGEYMDVDATPLDDMEVEIEDDDYDDDDDDDDNSSAGGSGGASDGSSKKEDNEDDIFS